MPANILLVDDNLGDIRLTREAFRECARPTTIDAVHDGVEAIAYLRRAGRFWNATRPDLILLDLNLPKKDGCEVLREIKRDPDLRRIPVVILTTSNADEDIARAYGLHANCYITKPSGLDQSMEVAREIEAFWLEVATLPPAAADRTP